MGQSIPGDGANGAHHRIPPSATITAINGDQGIPACLINQSNLHYRCRNDKNKPAGGSIYMYIDEGDSARVLTYIPAISRYTDSEVGTNYFI